MSFARMSIIKLVLVLLLAVGEAPGHPFATPATSMSEVVTSPPSPPKEDAFSHSKKVVCYYGSWSVYRPGRGKYSVEDLDPFLCTHYVYSFAGLSKDHKIQPLDSWNDLTEYGGNGAYKRFTDIKKVNPKVKTLIAIGGWNEGSTKYSTMAANETNRSTFIHSVLEFLAKYRFDGLDLDWEFPGERGGHPSDRDNFAQLIYQLKTAFVPRGYLLTAAVSARQGQIDTGYDVPKISRHLDMINIMAYDYHGVWENKTGHNAPLGPRPDEAYSDKDLNVLSSIKYWISKGAPPEKLVLGMPTYGRSFTLASESQNGLNAPAYERGLPGPYTKEPGSLGYNEICESLGQQSGWNIVFDPHHMVPYAWRGNQWVAYDDVQSIELKTKLASAMGLAGAMVWSIETDDFKATCHGHRHPLVRAINRIFWQEENTPQM